MSATEARTILDFYDLLTSGEKDYYRRLNQRIFYLRICQGFFYLANLSLLIVLIPVNLLIAICCSLLYAFALNSVVSELTKIKVNRILFEHKVGFERTHVRCLRKYSVDKISKL